MQRTRKERKGDIVQVAMDAMVEGRMKDAEQLLATAEARLTNAQRMRVYKELLAEKRIDDAMRVLTRKVEGPRHKFILMWSDDTRVNLEYHGTKNQALAKLSQRLPTEAARHGGERPRIQYLGPSRTEYVPISELETEEMLFRQGLL